jgi:hypothetical protein
MRLAAFGMAFGLAGCGSTPSSAVVGKAGDYNYSPSVIQSGNLQQFWWCGGGYNPINLQQNSDTILYESIDLSTHRSYGPLTVLAETPKAWDSVYSCNPKVVRGSFDNPVGDGQTYTYAMYYVGTSSNGIDNSIGVAFSNDGIAWKKYPQPVIRSTSQTNYGVGQPAIYNSDHKAGIWMFYEDFTPTIHHVEAISTDGIHFTKQGTLTTEGLDPNNPRPSWGDMAYDPETGYWYAGFNLPWRSPETTGGTVEYGQYGFELYRIPNSSLLTGATPWQQLMTVDTNLTGYESNFIPGFLRDIYGNLNVGPYPTIQLYTSTSDPQPTWHASPAAAGWSGRIPTWEILSAAWTPNNPPMALNRYINNAVHEVTTGWIDPNGGFHLESTLGHLFQAPQQGATVPFYGCKNGSMDYFVSLDAACDGQRILGVDGYGYSHPIAGLSLMPLYRCYTGHDHFVSTDPNCEGQTTEQLLGYALP